MDRLFRAHSDKLLNYRLSGRDNAYQNLSVFKTLSLEIFRWISPRATLHLVWREQYLYSWNIIHTQFRCGNYTTKFKMFTFLLKQTVILSTSTYCRKRTHSCDGYCAVGRLFCALKVKNLTVWVINWKNTTRTITVAEFVSFSVEIFRSIWLRAA